MVSEIIEKQKDTSYRVFQNDQSVSMQIFSDIYDCFSPKIYGLVLKQGCSVEEGERILIQVFFEAWDNRDILPDLKKNTFLELFKITCRILKVEGFSFRKLS